MDAPESSYDPRGGLLHNPVALLGPQPVEFMWLGTAVQFPPHDAHWWATTIWQPGFSLTHVWPGGHDDPELTRATMDAAWEGRITTESIETVGKDILEAVSGTYWWTTIRVMELARQGWHVLRPEMLRRNMRLEDMSLGDLVFWVVDTCTRGAAGAKDGTARVAALIAQLEAPPVSETARVAEELVMDAGALGIGEGNTFGRL